MPESRIFLQGKNNFCQIVSETFLRMVQKSYPKAKNPNQTWSSPILAPLQADAYPI